MTKAAREHGTVLWADGKIYTPKEVIERGCLWVDSAGTILAVGGPELAERLRNERVSGMLPVERSLQGERVLPGFIDLHVHGGGGYAMMEGTTGDLDGMSVFHAAHGTTSFLATTDSASQERICRALGNVAEGMRLGVSGAEVIGVHLEGPYLNVKRCGAQNKSHIRPPSVHELELFLSAAEDRIRLVTLAPEMAGGEAAMALLRERGITISIGHSDATIEQVRAAVRCGASQTTHHFNGMSPFHHREPGVAGAGLMIGELTAELIADGIHVHPEAVRFLMETKGPGGVCLITDCVLPAGAP